MFTRAAVAVCDQELGLCSRSLQSAHSVMTLMPGIFSLALLSLQFTLINHVSNVNVLVKVFSFGYGDLAAILSSFFADASKVIWLTYGDLACLSSFFADARKCAGILS